MSRVASFRIRYRHVFRLACTERQWPRLVHSPGQWAASKRHCCRHNREKVARHLCPRDPVGVALLLHANQTSDHRHLQRQVDATYPASSKIRDRGQTFENRERKRTIYPFSSARRPLQSSPPTTELLRRKMPMSFLIGTCVDNAFCQSISTLCTLCGVNRRPMRSKSQQSPTMTRQFCCSSFSPALANNSGYLADLRPSPRMAGRSLAGSILREGDHVNGTEPGRHRAVFKP